MITKEATRQPVGLGVEQLGQLSLPAAPACWSAGWVGKENSLGKVGNEGNETNGVSPSTVPAWHGWGIWDVAAGRELRCFGPSDLAFDV